MASLEEQTKQAFPTLISPIMPPPRAEDASLPTPKKEDVFGDTISRMSAESFSKAWEAATKAGTIDVNENDPRLLTAFKQANQYIADMAAAGLYTAQGGFEAAAGAIGEVFGGSPQGEMRLARDVAGMGEAFAGSGVSRGANLLDDLTESSVTALKQVPNKINTVTGSSLIRKPKNKTNSTNGVTEKNNTLEDAPEEIFIGQDLFTVKGTPKEGFSTLKKTVEEEALDSRYPSLQGPALEKIKAIDALGEERLLSLAENLPHFNDKSYVDYLNSTIKDAAKDSGVSQPTLMEFVNDLSKYFPSKTDPKLDELTEVNLPRQATIGVPASPKRKTTKADLKADNLGFKETVYHSSKAEGDFPVFNVDSSKGQDLLGPHVGTARAAAERNFKVGEWEGGPAGFTMELRARTDRPLTRDGISKIVGKDFGKRSAPFTEVELNEMISAFEDKLFKNSGYLPDSRKLATLELRKKLAEEGYTHIPYINEVEDIGSTSYIMLTDRPKNSPAVLRDSRAEFDPKKVTDPDLRFAEGGLTMDEQMNKLFAEGGVNTGNAKVDPVSGNEVPPGSMPREVRDDIDAKLSGGEYVVPADVLRYYGVAFFEKLRAKAKAGLEEMNADGRIGGGMPEEEDDFPFSVDELQTEEVGFAEGGMTTPTPAPTGTFNPSDWSLGSSFDSGGGMGQTQVKKYQDKDGNIINVLFIDGKPVVDVNALGYTEYKEETPVATGEEVKAPEAPRESDRDRAPPEPPKERTPVDPAENYYNLSEADLLNPNYKALGNDKIAKGLAMVSPILGAGAGLIRGIKEAENLADARARAIIAKERGFDTSALDAQIKDMEANASGFVKAADFVGLDGKNIVKNMQKDLKTYTPTTPTTVGGGTKVSTGGGSTIKSPTTPTAGSSDRSNAGTSTPSAPSAASASTGTKLGFGSAPNGKTISTSVTGSGNLGFGSSMSGKSAITAPTKASDYKPAATDISKGSTSSLNKDYGTVGSARGGRAKGGLVEKPKKVVKTKTNRKTKI